MPEISIFKTIVKFISGVERIPKALLKKQAEKKAMLQGRYKSCDELLLTIPAVTATVPAEKRKELENEYAELQKEFEYLCKHFKKSTPELDKRLEIVILKARTLKIYAACLGAIDNTDYANNKQTIADLLDDINTLKKQTFLHHEDVNSGVLIAYKQDLNNLETKAKAQFESSGISFNMSED